jgi:copper chaperone NosL
MKVKLNGWTRLLIVFAGIALIGPLFLPIWRIELGAPQYPEGLVLLIYANKLGGNVDIVNGLNHYIGMRALHAQDFPEFSYLRYVIGFFSVACLIVAALGKRVWLIVLLSLYGLFAILAMVDFWNWEYKYGHELNPEAAIQVPGMSYQPPLIGYKQLLNFGAYSIPDMGGWLMAAAGCLLALAVWFSFWRVAKAKYSAAALVLLAAFLSSCSSGPVPIKVGVDNCDFCKMSVADARFGAEVLNNKGKAWKFDDTHCLIAFLKEGTLKSEDIKEIYFVRFDGSHELLPSEKALLLQSEALHSPMGGNAAAFADESSLQKVKQELNGNEVKWGDLRNDGK